MTLENETHVRMFILLIAVDDVIGGVLSVRRMCELRAKDE